MRYRYLRFPEGKFKAVTFSYDDGVLPDLRLAKLLSDRGMKCTFNINSGFIGGSGRNARRLTEEEIREYLVPSEHEIALHGAKHIASASQTPSVAMLDALECRTELEDKFDMIIRGMAYPDSGIRRPSNGNSYDTVRGILSSLGIAYSRTLGSDNDRFAMPEDFYAWMPTAHHNNPEIFNWIEKFNALSSDNIGVAGRHPRLFYVWGHSYEFDVDDNWERIEKIADMLSEREDTWYATNIEIYDYVKAYDSLVLSADNTIIYNPTLYTIWFTQDGKNYSIESGETLMINE